MAKCSNLFSIIISYSLYLAQCGWRIPYPLTDSTETLCGDTTSHTGIKCLQNIQGMRFLLHVFVYLFFRSFKCIIHLDRRHLVSTVLSFSWSLILWSIWKILMHFLECLYLYSRLFCYLAYYVCFALLVCRTFSPPMRESERISGDSILPVSHFVWGVDIHPLSSVN